MQVCLNQMFLQIHFWHSCVECLHIRIFHTINLNVKLAVSKKEHLKKGLIKNVALIYDCYQTFVFYINIVFNSLVEFQFYVPK